jgi:hypothetical protein
VVLLLSFLCFCRYKLELRFFGADGEGVDSCEPLWRKVKVAVTSTYYSSGDVARVASVVRGSFVAKQRGIRKEPEP